MATYCFRCRNCGAQFNGQTPGTAGELQLPCAVCGEAAIVRDYRAENVGVAVEQLRQEREAGGREQYKRLFLPHNDDFKGPGDPDGTKGMRAWRESNQPKAGNKNPDWPGYVEKKVM